MSAIPKDVEQALINAYYYINQYKSAQESDPKYWEWKRQEVMAECMRAFESHKIDHTQQNPEDR